MNKSKKHLINCVKTMYKPQMKYAVVSFINDETAGDEEIASEVPISWVSTDKKQCWWPKVKNVNTLIIRSVPPEIDNPKWELHDINCQGFYETVEVARKRAENIFTSIDEKEKNCRARQKKFTRAVSPIEDLESSDCGSDIPNMKLPEFPTLVKKPTCFTQHDLESSPQCSYSKPEQINQYTSRAVTEYSPAPSKLQTKKDSNRDSTIDSLNLIDGRNNSIITSNHTAQNKSATDISLSDVLIDDLPIIFNQDADLRNKIVQTIENLNAAIIKTVNDNFHRTFTAMASLSIETRTLSERMNKIEQLMTKTHVGLDTEAFAEICAIFPFKIKENILVFEDSLATNPDLTDKLVKYLSQIGGSTAKENIIRILRRVFPNAVAQQSSWLGLRNNFKISGLKITDAIKAVVVMRFTITDRDFEEIASEWLRQAKQRLVREEKRAEK